MGKAEDAIVKWAEGQTDKPATSKPDYSRLTSGEIAALIQLHKEGFTQTEIAQRLNCSQRTVSKWLADLADTTEPAKFYLRGQAMRMARNIVNKGRASDHIKALEGINVLTPEQKPSVVWQIGIKADSVKLVSPVPIEAQSESHENT